MNTEISKKPETKKQKELAVSHADYYNKPKKEGQEIVAVSTRKKKVIRIRTYGNGLEKRDLVGMIKDGKIIYDKGIDKEALGIK